MELIIKKVKMLNTKYTQQFSETIYVKKKLYNNLFPFKRKKNIEKW